MKENHSFDNYFGTYPGVYGGYQSNVCVREADGRCVYPFALQLHSDPALLHTFTSAYEDWNHGKMNNFLQGERQAGSPNPRNAFGYFTNQTIPNYWLYAKNYVLDDSFFSSVFGWSLPNHWLAVAGAVPACGVNFDTCDIQTHLTLFLQEAKPIPTIADTLVNSKVSWKYYDTPLGTSFDLAVDNAQKYGCVSQITPDACSLWQPFASQERSYSQAYTNHYVSNSEIFTDISSGKLPNVSYVIPDGWVSEHPPQSVGRGMDWTTSIVNAVMNSSYWGTTAIIVSWDDYGGFYDSVPPVKLDKMNECIAVAKSPVLNPDCYLGFRVPALIISSYSRQGYIDNTQYSFESILKFIDWNWHLPYLDARIRDANNLLNSFNFSKSSPDPTAIIPMSQDYVNYLINLGSNASSPDVD
jgi:phospholipase C